MDLTKEYLKNVLRQCKADMKAAAKEYGMPESAIEERQWAKAEAILSCTTREQVDECIKRAISSVNLSGIAGSHSGRFPGRITAQTLEIKAKKNEGLAKWKASQGNDKAANRALERAKKLHEEAERMRKGST